MNYSIVDRRKNPSGKSIPNRQKFLNRAKESLRKSVKEGIQDRSIISEDGENVHIPSRSIHEPVFRNDPKTGDSDYVLPGNHEYVPGDLIEKPSGGSGGGGSAASANGDGEDDFEFELTKDEFYDIAFEDLELPNMVKESQKAAVSWERQRAGFVSDGNPSQMDLLRSMKNSIGRRIALKRPKSSDLELLEKQIKKEKDKEVKKSLKLQLDELKKKSKIIPYIDPIDLRYKNYEKVPKPKSQAVMFCIMDVSASMGSVEKDLAKRFYILLYQFLRRKYRTVDIVFIRHHSRAVECDEEEFFYSKETGGTVVSEGYQLMLDIQKDRYPASEWNIYVSQASDGDNFDHDNPALTYLLETQVFSLVQFLMYVEVKGISDRDQYYGSSASSLWPIMESAADEHDNVVIGKIREIKEVYAVFREMFLKEECRV